MFVLRRLKRDFLYAGAVIAILSVGIGLNLAVTEAFEALFFRAPTSLRNAGELVRIRIDKRVEAIGAVTGSSDVSFPDYVDLVRGFGRRVELAGYQDVSLVDRKSVV